MNTIGANIMIKAARSLILSASACLLAAGCTTTYVHIETDPQGAVVSSADGTETYGEAPIDVEFDKNALKENGGVVPGFTAEWKSGAKASTENPYVINDVRYGAEIKLVRPKDAPGEAEDLRYALEKAEKEAADLREENEKLRTDWRPDGFLIFPGPIIY